MTAKTSTNRPPVISFNSLPVPPEFSSMLNAVLFEQVHPLAWDTLKECLEVLKVPAEVVALIEDLNELVFYGGALAGQSGESGAENAEVLEAIFRTAESMAAVGGSFEGKRRKSTLLEKAGPKINMKAEA